MSGTIVHNRTYHIIDTSNIIILSSGAVTKFLTRGFLTRPVICYQESSWYLQAALLQMNNSTNVSLVYLRPSRPSGLYHLRNDLCDGCIFEMYGIYFSLNASFTGTTNVEHNLREASASFGWNRLFHPIWTLKTTVDRALLNGCKEKTNMQSVHKTITGLSCLMPTRHSWN